MEENKVKKVLIVEDDKILGLDLKLSLEAMGYNVYGPATNYEDAVRLAYTEEPEVVLMDIQIKGQKNGIDTAKTLRENLDIPVIYLTSTIEEQVMMRAIETEPAGYLLKPFRKEEVRNNIEIAFLTQVKTRQLKNDLNRFSSAIMQLEDPIIITKSDGKISFFNKAAEQVSGFSKFEVLDHPIEEILNFGFKNREFVFIDVKKSENKSLDFFKSITLNFKSGLKVDLQGVISYFSDAEGNDDGYIFTLQVVDEKENEPGSLIGQETARRENNVITDEYVFIKDKGQLFRVNVNDILYIEALGDYVNVFCESNRYTTLMTMKKLEVMLPSEKFCRIHRSFIVNFEKITGVNNADLDIFIGQKRIPIGETYKAELMKRVKVL